MEAIIFDFDGVIIESTQLKADAFAFIYKKFGEAVVRQVVAHHLQNGGMSRYKKIVYYHRNFLGKDIQKEEIKELVDEFSEYVMSHIDEVPLVNGVIEFLEKYRNRYKMFISSGTPQEELHQTIKNRRLEKYFSGIYGSPESKTEHIQKILAENNLFVEQVIFVGDGKKDKEAAEKTGLKFIARLTEYNNFFKNEKYKIRDFSELEEVITKIDMSDLIC